MPLPIDIVLVRHGESEGNLANKASRNGDTKHFTPEHLDRHSAYWRLTDNGIKQAKSAGEWIRKNIAPEFDYYLTSAFIRARETAGHLNLTNAKWEIDPYLIERDHGDLDGLTPKQKAQFFGGNLAKRDLQEFYWRPPNGETRIEAGLRADRVVQNLAIKHSDHKVIIVAHETLIEAILIRRLHWTVEEFSHWKAKNKINTKIHNCQVVHLSRRDPKTGNVGSNIRFFRSVCPWDETLSINNWQEIKKKMFSNAELLKQADGYKRVIGG